MAELLVGGVAAFFFLMGCYALADPEGVLARFGTPSLSVDGRNEVRAVYGGFGLAIAGVLAACLPVASIRTGALLSIAAALIGMALGRVASLALDGTAGRTPWLFFFIELGLAAALLGALRVGFAT